jgi:DNA polymerase III epsilon subunit-like protein
VRYFLDTEFNGFGGELLSLALVPEDGEEFYATLACEGALLPWVEQNVLPFLDHVPVGLESARLSRRDAAIALSHYLAIDPEPAIIADWPEDIAQFCNLLMTGPGEMVPIPQIRFTLLPLAGFSTAMNSVVPHNALHDARALKEHLLGLEP